MSFIKKSGAALVALAVLFTLSAAPVAAQHSISAPPSSGGVYSEPGPVSPPQAVPPPGGEEGQPPSEAVACALQLIQPGESPPGWTNKVWYWANETRGLLEVLVQPEVGDTYALLYPPEGTQVEYTVWGSTQAAGESSPGFLLIHPGEQFRVRAKVFFPSINGNILVQSEEVTLGDVRLSNLTGDPTRLGLTPVGPIKSLWVPQIVKDQQGYVVQSTTLDGPGMSPDARAAIEIVEVLPPGAAGRRAYLGCRIEELRSGDRFIIVGAVSGKDYSVKVHTYLPSSDPALGDVGTRGAGFIIRR